jgi:hypothetical protein
MGTVDSSHVTVSSKVNVQGPNDILSTEISRALIGGGEGDWTSIPQVEMAETLPTLINNK